MSGIALVAHLDGKPAEPDDLAAMLAQMARRGPVGQDVVVAGSVALGHRHLPTTPEALIEPMPLVDPGSGCHLTGDIRLDNRDTLLATFGLSEAGRIVGDGALVLHAWNRWGEDCAQHLLGDFAFALWNPRRRVVFAARDHMGMRQLVYSHRPGRVFVCATSARAVAVQPRIMAGLNDLRIAEALVDFEHGNLTTTFHESVFRLPPGHSLTVSEAGLKLWAYWQMTPPAPLRLKSDDEYAEAFREVLSVAVQARLRGAGPVGSMLSGGMDSGAVVALASRMTDAPLPTFSAVGSDPATCVETRAIHSALTLPNLAPTLVSHDDLAPWQDDLLASWRALEEPWDLHMTLPRAAYLAAQRAGVTVVLDGVAGDTLLDEGNQMVQHLRSGQVWRACRDAHGMARYFGLGPQDAIQQLVTATRRAFVPKAISKLRGQWRDRSLPPLPERHGIDPGFAEQTGVRQVMQAWLREGRNPRQSFAVERILDYSRSGLTVGRERYDRVAAHFGIEPRDPFMDQRLWSFCLSLPADQFQAGGWPKIVLRRAMQDLVPDDVRWRHSKEHLGWRFTKALFDSWPDWQATIRASQTQLHGKLAPALLDPACWDGTRLDKDLLQLEKLLEMAVFVDNLP